MYSTTSPPGQLKDDPMDLRNGFDIKRYIRTIPDYPKPGILFRDITTLLADPHGFRACTDELMWPFLRQHIDYVVGIEARGFILGRFSSRCSSCQASLRNVLRCAARASAPRARFSARDLVSELSSRATRSE